MALSRRRLRQAESLLSVALGMAAFAGEDSAREIKRLAEKPLQDWADDDVAAVMTWVAQRGPKAADGRMEHRVDLVLNGWRLRQRKGSKEQGRDDTWPLINVVTLTGTNSSSAASAFNRVPKPATKTRRARSRPRTASG